MGTQRRSFPRDDQHGWFYHVEEAYYSTGNLWIKDWYRFGAEYRRVFLERKDPFPDGSSRGIGHALAHAMQAYRITGNRALLLTARTPALVTLKASILPTGARNSSCCPPPLFESVFMTGYLSRALINYLEEVPTDTAGVLALVRGFVKWNVEHANFGYDVDPTNPKLQAASNGTALTMGDPQAWWAWRQADQAALTHLNRYIDTGINRGSPAPDELKVWRGDFSGRITQFMRDGTAPPPAPPSPRSPPSSPTAVPANVATASSPPGPGPHPLLAPLHANQARDLGPYACTQMAGDQSCAEITDYSRFTYDPSGHQMLMFGGGHATTFRDDVDVLALSPHSTLRWAPAYASTPCTAMTLENFDQARGVWTSTGHPLSRHTYDMLVMTPQGLILLAGLTGRGGCAPNPPGRDPFFVPGKIHHYNPATRTWTAGGSMSNWGPWNSAEYDPPSGKILVVGYNSHAGAGTLWLYDPVTKQSSATGISIPDAGQTDNLVYYPPTQKHYLIRKDGALFEVTLNRSNFAASTVSAVRGTTGPLPSSGETGWAYDSANQIIGGGVHNGIFYAYHPPTKTWTARTMQPLSGGPIGTVAFHALEYDPVNNVFIFLTNGPSGRHTWAYRWR